MTAPSHTTMLDDLATMAMDLARAVHANAMRDGTPTPDQVATFDRAARTVRRTVLLSRRLAELPPPAVRRTEHRAKIIRAVEDAINREHGETEPADRLRAEFAERLDTTELDEAWSLRPTAERIADIRHDLGLDVAPGTRPWCRRTPAEIRDLRRRAAAAPPSTNTPPEPPPTRRLRPGQPSPAQQPIPTPALPAHPPDPHLA